MNSFRSHAGFTLIELLLVIGVIAILAAVVIIAVDPVSQLRKAMGIERTHYTRQLEKAITQYVIEYEQNPGELAFSTTSDTPTNICRFGQTNGTCVNIDELAPVYIGCIPYDTLETDANLSGFSVYQVGGFVTVESVYDAPDASGDVVCLEPAETVTGFTFNAPPNGTSVTDVNGIFVGTMANMAPPSGYTAELGPTNISTSSWRFDGANDTVSIPYNSAFDLTTELSFTAWVYPTAFTAADTVNSIVRKGEANPNMWQLAIEDGYATLMLEQGDGANGRAQSPSQLNLNTWQHIAGTWDGTTATIYVNGTSVDSNAYSGTNGGELATDSRDVYIGGRTGSDYFAGNMYDVRIYNTALSAVHVAKIAAGKM